MDISSLEHCPNIWVSGLNGKGGAVVRAELGRRLHGPSDYSGKMKGKHLGSMNQSFQLFPTTKDDCIFIKFHQRADLVGSLD